MAINMLQRNCILTLEIAQYSDSLQAGQSGVRNPAEVRDMHLQVVLTCGYKALPAKNVYQISECTEGASVHFCSQICFRSPRTADPSPRGESYPVFVRH